VAIGSMRVLAQEAWAQTLARWWANVRQGGGCRAQHVSWMAWSSVIQWLIHIDPAIQHALYLA